MNMRDAKKACGLDNGFLEYIICCGIRKTPSWPKLLENQQAVSLQIILAERFSYDNSRRL